MIKKILLLLLIPLIFTACSTKNYEEIVFSSWGSVTEVEIIKKIITDFEKEYPQIKVKFLHIPQNYFQKLHLLFVSKMEPDVIFINNIYLPIYSSHLEDLSDKIDTQNFFNEAIDAMSYQNKVYAIPRDLSFFVFYVNTDLIELPTSNWKLNDLLEISKSDKLKNCYTIGYERGIYYALPFIKYFGGGILNDSHQEIINSKESLLGINFYKDLKDKYKIAPNESDVASLTVAQLFLNKKIALYLSGRWMYPKILEKADFNWSVINFPYGKSPMPCDVSGWAISKNSKHKESALKFIKFLSNEKNAIHFTKTGLIVPANKKATSLLNDYKHNEKIFIDSIYHSKTTTVNKNYNKLIDKINLDFNL